MNTQTTFRDYEIILGTETPRATNDQKAAAAARLRAAGIDPEDQKAVYNAYEDFAFEAVRG